MSQGFALGKQGRSEKSVDTDRPLLTVVNKYPLYFVCYFGVFLQNSEVGLTRCSPV